MAHIHTQQKNTPRPASNNPGKPEPPAYQNCEFVYLAGQGSSEPRQLTMEQLVADSAPADVDIDSFALYGDLDESLQSVREKELQKKLEESREVILKLQNDSKEANRKLMALVRQNATLLKNISSLFRTAQAELGRKDKLVSELRQDIEKKDRMIKELTSSASSASHIVTESSRSSGKEGEHRHLPVRDNSASSSSLSSSSSRSCYPDTRQTRPRNDHTRQHHGDNGESPRSLESRCSHEESRHRDRDEYDRHYRNDGYTQKDREYRHSQSTYGNKPR